MNTLTLGVTPATFSAKTDFTTGIEPASVSIADFNGDGKKDLAVLIQGTNLVSVFLNTTTPGASTPTYSAGTDFATEDGPQDLTIGDLNGDGKPDMAFTNVIANAVSVYFNTTTPGASTPAFSSRTDFATGTGPYSVKIGDLNGDGKPDLVIANYFSNSVSVFFNTTTPGASTPTFSPRTDFPAGLRPNSVTIGDLNGDGKPDLATANITAGTVSVYLNTTTPGASTPTFSAKTDFTTGSSSVSYGVSIGDLNGDGKPDMAASNYVANSVSVFLNTTTPGASTPTFTAKTDFTTGTRTSGASIGDLNGDGKPEEGNTDENATTVAGVLHQTLKGNTTATLE